jgi:hypothetical protein
MDEAKHSTETSTLEETRRQFEQWRASREKSRTRIPPELWQQALNLIGSYSLNQVSRTLGLGYTDLKKRYAAESTPSVNPVPPPATPRFVELTLNKPLSAVSEYVMEVEDREGKKLRLTIRDESAGLNVIALAKGLWEMTS